MATVQICRAFLVLAFFCQLALSMRVDFSGGVINNDSYESETRLKRNELVSSDNEPGQNEDEPDDEEDDPEIVFARAYGLEEQPGFEDGSDDEDDEEEDQNAGEPDYVPRFLELREEEFNRNYAFDTRMADDDEVNVPDSVWQNDADHTYLGPPYLRLRPEAYKNLRPAREEEDVDDAIPVPDSVWNAEKNETNAYVRSQLRQTSPPSQACLSIKVVYNSGWVNSAGGGNQATAHQRALDVVAETQNIYNNKYSAANRLGTAIALNLVAAPTFDASGSWQATGSDLQNSDVQAHVDTGSYTTQHYAFLSGADGGGAIGIAYLGTPCLQIGSDQKYKKSINEWYNNVADSAGVLAHEIGHALGMPHDFGSGGTSDTRYDSNGNSCTGINGLMDYGARRNVDKFSTCSKEDFVAFYQRMVSVYGSFCMTCSSSPTTAAPPNPTTVAPPNPTTVAPPNPTTAPPPTGTCNGVPRTDWSCCTATNPCSPGGGDCDRDSHCAGSLKCGRNNCRRDFPSTGSNWAKAADCCEAPPSCDGVPSTDWNCCNRKNKCSAGKGDCDFDSHCAGNLICGSDNCKRDFSSAGSNWSGAADCCIAPPTCSGVPTTDWNCCTDNNQCAEGKGDCDNDSHCAGKLVCGTDNCRRDFASPGSNWAKAADCCKVAPPPASCNGVPRTDWNCCSATNQCAVGGGDCDNDSHCAGSLKCGTNNCRRDFSSTGSNWAKAADCCVDASNPATTAAPPPATTANPNPTTAPPATTANPNPPSASCGVKPASIVGGSEVTPYSLPWQVAFVSRGSSRPFCGGTLISDRHVLTAAHCTTSGRQYDVIVGEHRITSSSDGTRHSVCRAVDHPSYGSLNNDFSILHLNTPVTIGTRAAPACLPPTTMGGDFFNGRTMTVSGWGALTQGGGSPSVLHSVDVPGITNAACGKLYGGITSAMLCAGNVASGGIDSCQGDSGGPLTYTTGGKTYIVGVVSWGAGCAQAGKPGVYARVSEAMSFINGQLSQKC